MRYCFYSGYKDLKGGYTTLLLTLISGLVRQQQQVVLINFSNGIISDELKKQDISISMICLDKHNWEEIASMILPTDIFIIIRFEEVLKYLFNVNPLIVYYDINDFIGQISDYKFGLRFRFLGKKLVTHLIGRKSLFFMDDSGLGNLKKHFGISITHPDFLPIPVTVPSENIYSKRKVIGEDSIHLTYIGRSVKWKMMPLQRILEDCLRVSKTRKIRFSVVVDNLAEFKKYININEFNAAPNLCIRVEENMPPSAINEFLLQNADLHFAMGTAALDAAKLGIPTILVDYSERPFPEGYQYKWLYDTTHYSLGRNLEKMPANNGVSMDTILDILSGEGDQLQLHSERSYHYVMNNHSVENIVHQLMWLCSKAEFRLNSARQFVPFFWKMHSLIKNLTGSQAKN